MVLKGDHSWDVVVLYALMFACLFSVVKGRPEMRRSPYMTSSCPDGSRALQLCDARRPNCPPQYYCYAVGSVESRLYGCCTEMYGSYYPHYQHYPQVHFKRQRLSPQGLTADVIKEDIVPIERLSFWSNQDTPARNVRPNTGY